MRRAVAAGMSWWLRLFVMGVLAQFFLAWPWWLETGVIAAVFALAMVRPPRADERAPIWLAPPVSGRWRALNSPATNVPSHGVRAYGQSHAIDILQPPIGDPDRPGWGAGMRPPADFASFGQPVYAVAPGTVVTAGSGQRDHRSRSSWPALIYLLTVEGLVRELGGVRFIVGNHLIVDHGDGTFAAYAHLRRASLRVNAGDRVIAGQQLAEVGNSGNTSEPHLHFQIMDRTHPLSAAGLPFRWRGVRAETSSEQTTGLDGLPANGQDFTGVVFRS